MRFMLENEIEDEAPKSVVTRRSYDNKVEIQIDGMVVLTLDGAAKSAKVNDLGFKYNGITLI